MVQPAWRHRRASPLRQRRRLPLTRVADTCQELGIQHKRTRPHRPQSNGKIEHFHRTLADGWAYTRRYTSDTERRGELEGRPHCYNSPPAAHGLRQPPAPLTIDNVPGQYD